MAERLLTISETCKRLGIHPNTLRKWDEQGRVKCVRAVGGRRMPELVEDFAEKLNGMRRCQTAYC